MIELVRSPKRPGVWKLRRVDDAGCVEHLSSKWWGPTQQPCPFSIDQIQNLPRTEIMNANSNMFRYGSLATNSPKDLDVRESQNERGQLKFRC